MANENEVKFVVDVSQPKQVLDDVINKTKQLNQALSKDTTAAFAKVSSEGSMSFTKLAGAIGLATGAYQILATAVQKSIETVKESFNLYSKEENFIQRIGFALNNNSLLTERFIKLRDELNKNPLFTKEQISQGIEFAVSMGRSESQVRKLVEAAEGYSRVSGKDFQTALTELNGTLNGTIGRLGKYVEGVKGMSTTQAKNGDVLEKAYQQLGKYGDKAGQIETAQAKLSKQWAETEETLGKKLAPVLTVILKLLGDFITYWANVGEAAVRVGQRLYTFTEKYLKPVIPVVEGIIKGIKFLTTGLAEVILMIDKLTGGQDLYKSGDKMIEYQKKVEDDYAKSDDKWKKKTLDREKKHYEDSLALEQKYTDEGDLKRAASQQKQTNMYKELVDNLQKIDVKSKPESDPAEQKKLDETEKKKQEAINKTAKNKFDALKKEKEERDKYNKENLKLDEEYVKAENEINLQENANKIKVEQESADVNLINLNNLYEERKKIIQSGVDAETKALNEEVKSLSSTLDVLTQTPEQYNNIIKNIEALQLKIKQVTVKGETEINAVTEQNRKSKEDKLKEEFDKQLRTTVDYQKKVSEFQKANQSNGVSGFTKEQLEVLDKAKKGVDDVTSSLEGMIDAEKSAGTINSKTWDELNEKIKQTKEDVKNTSSDVTETVKQSAKDLKNEIVGALGEGTSKVINALFENAAQQTEKALQNTMDAIDKMATKESGNLDKLLKNKYISEAEYERRKDALDNKKLQQETEAKKEKAKKDKKLAEEQALINAFLAASMTLATMGVPAGIAGAAVALALGLVDFGIIAAKPLEYKFGTSKVPPMFAAGGFTEDVPMFDTGGFTSPNGNQNGIPAILHPNEAVLNSTAMSAPGMPQMVTNINTGQPIQTTTLLHPDSINAIISGINNKQVFVSQYDITKQQNKVNVLQGRASL